MKYILSIIFSFTLLVSFSQIKVNSLDEIQANVTTIAHAGLGQEIHILDTDARYIVTNSTISGYGDELGYNTNNGAGDPDGIAVIDIGNGKYAILQPEDEGYNLEWFDIKNDGSNLYRENIQRAFDFAHYTGNTIVRFPPYTVEWGINSLDLDDVYGRFSYFWLEDNLQLIGTKGVSIFKFSDLNEQGTQNELNRSWFYGFQADGLDNIVLDGIIFDGNKLNTVSNDEQTHLFNLSRTDNIEDNFLDQDWLVQNCTFLNFRRDAFKLYDCENFTYKNNIFDGCQRASIVFQTSLKDINIHHNKFVNCGDGCLDSEATGNFGMENIWISDNEFGKWNQGGNIITLGGSGSNSPALNNYVVNNTFRGGAIRILSCLECHVSGNTWRIDVESIVPVSRIPDPDITLPVLFEARRNGKYYFEDNVVQFPDETELNTFLSGYGNINLYAAALVITATQVTNPDLIVFRNNKIYDVPVEYGTVFDIKTTKSGIIQGNYITTNDNLRLFRFENESGELDMQKFVFTDNIFESKTGFNSCPVIPRYTSYTTPIPLVNISNNNFRGVSDFPSFDIRDSDLAYGELIVKGNTTNNKLVDVLNTSLFRRISDNLYAGDGVPTFTTGIGTRYIRQDVFETYEYNGTAWVVQ